MYFSSGSPYPAMALGALKGLVDIGHKKQAIIYCVEAEQCPAWRDIAKAKAAAYGVEIVYEAQVSLAQPDFTAECIAAQRNGATGIHSAIDGPSIARLAKSCAQQGYKPQYMGISLAIIDSISKEPALEGLMAPQGNFPFTSASTPAEAEYQDTRAEYAPNLANSPAVATVWAAGALLREAVKGTALPPGKVSSRDLLNGLYTLRDNTLDGLSGAPLTFVEGQNPKKLVNCLYYIRLTGAQVDRALRVQAGLRRPVKGERAMNLGNWLRLAWDRAAAVALIAAGAVALILGWVGSERRSLPGQAASLSHLGGDRRRVHPRDRHAVLAVGRHARRVDEARPDRDRPQPPGRHRPGRRRRRRQRHRRPPAGVEGFGHEPRRTGVRAAVDEARRRRARRAAGDRRRSSSSPPGSSPPAGPTPATSWSSSAWRCSARWSGWARWSAGPFGAAG